MPGATVGEVEGSALPSAPSAADKAAQFMEVWRLAVSTIRPEPIVIYKPQKAGNGVVAKFNLSLRPTYGDTFVQDVDGGLFVDLVAQGPDKNGFPSFRWDDKKNIITAKFGLADISGLLSAIRDFRENGREVATYLRGRDAKPNVVSLFHKTDTSGTTGISYSFEPESSVIRVSKSRDVYRSISLTLGEELVLQRYLLFGLDAFIRVGMR